MTNIKDIDIKMSKLLIPVSRHCSMAFAKIWLMKYNELKTTKWQLTFKEAGKNKNHVYEDKCRSAGIKIKVIGGNNVHVYKEIFDAETGIPVTWGTLIERMSGR